MKIVFMGTPDFAVPTLQKMVDMGIEITAVVTQPDKAKGRGKKVIYSPVKECALAHDLPVYQPVRIKKDPEFIQTLRDMAPDVIHRFMNKSEDDAAVESAVEHISEEEQRVRPTERALSCLTEEQNRLKSIE